MARRRRQAQESERESDDVPPRNDGNRLLIVGAVALAIGFGTGYAVGLDGAGRGVAPAASGPFANAPFAGGAAMASGAGDAAMGGGAGGNLAPAVLPPPHKGHTFTGDINVPPHSEQAHELADVLLRGITCPCGGCDHMTLDQCGCDTSKEVGGYAAHLLERGKRGDEVLQQLKPRYELALDDGILSRARGITLASASMAGGPMSASMDAAPDAASAPAPAANAAADPAGGSAALEGLEGLEDLAKKPTVQRLTDVPTSARPASK